MYLFVSIFGLVIQVNPLVHWKEREETFSFAYLPS